MTRLYYPTTYANWSEGCLAPRATARLVTKWSPPSRWWWEPGPMFTTWSALRVSSAATGMWTRALSLIFYFILTVSIQWRVNHWAILSGFVWVTSSICTITKSFVDLTTRNEFCSLISTSIRIELLKSRIRPGSFPPDPPRFLHHHLPPHTLATASRILHMDILAILFLRPPPAPRPPPHIQNVQISILFPRYPRSKASQKGRHSLFKISFWQLDDDNGGTKSFQNATNICLRLINYFLVNFNWTFLLLIIFI